MPCRVDEPYEAIPKKPMETVHGLEAALCGMMTVLIKNGDIEKVMRSFDDKEAGITTHEIMEWWRIHQAKDVARRKHEAEVRNRDIKKKAALDKLTAEERNLLGLR